MKFCPPGGLRVPVQSSTSTALEQNCCCFQYRLVHLTAHWSQVQEESPLLLSPQITVWRRISSWQLLLLLLLMLPQNLKPEVQNLRQDQEGSVLLVLRRHHTRTFTVLCWKPWVSPQTCLGMSSLNKTAKLKVAWCAICLPLPGIHPALSRLGIVGLTDSVSFPWFLIFFTWWCAPETPDVPMIPTHLLMYPFLLTNLSMYPSCLPLVRLFPCVFAVCFLLASLQCTLSPFPSLEVPFLPYESLDEFFLFAQFLMYPCFYPILSVPFPPPLPHNVPFPLTYILMYPFCLPISGCTLSSYPVPSLPVLLAQFPVCSFLLLISCIPFLVTYLSLYHFLHSWLLMYPCCLLVFTVPFLLFPSWCTIFP